MGNIRRLRETESILSQKNYMSEIVVLLRKSHHSDDVFQKGGEQTEQREGVNSLLGGLLSEKEGGLIMARETTHQNGRSSSVTSNGCDVITGACSARSWKFAASSTGASAGASTGASTGVSTGANASTGAS